MTIHSEQNPASSIRDSAALKSEAAEKALKDAKENRPTLLSMEPKKAAKFMRGRWKRLDSVMRKKQTELKVNYLRYLGDQFVQVHPRDDERILIPPTGDSRQPPQLNKLRRSVHRYVAQVTADEPVIEALPASHADEDRDASEAASHTLLGEWHRMDLQLHLQRVAQLSAIFRSGFWFFEYDKTDGGRTPAQKFFENPETGDQEIHFVDSDGNKVESESDAAMIWKGNLVAEVMTPMNVRWQGGRYAHDADELMVAKIVKLRDLFEDFPKTRDVALEKLVGDVPPEAEKWLEDIRGENFRSGMKVPDDVDLETMLGSHLDEDSALLDHPAFLMHYFLKPSKRYPGGFHGIIVGRTLLRRGKLRWGVLPISHFKLLDEVSEPLGVSLIDLLRDPQELLDFVRGQILRHLQMMRRRWFLPEQSNVSPRDLMSPSRSVITYNARAGKPEAETQPEIPTTIFEFLQKSGEDFNEILGLQGPSLGQHVPGVSSGRHAEALQQADITLLGLTRQQFRNALEHAGLVILNAVKKEWTTERRVRYIGENRDYVDKSFMRTDFRDTSDVRLKNSTLLMLTKSQRLETIFGYVELGAITPDELRRLAPLADTAGLSLNEDQHVQRARRQNEKYLAGPPEEAIDAWEDFQLEMDQIQSDIEAAEDAMRRSPEVAEDIVPVLAEKAEQAQASFDETMARFMPDISGAETLPHVAALHVEEHSIALASEKTERFRRNHPWWVEYFEENHFMADLQAAQPPQPEEGELEANGLGPAEGEAIANPEQLPAPGL